ncbi:hypothetical protein O181_089569 [Austropuccinia psidii MF-1]|uniref:DUF4939 domain-containing protein n=1 Tax=Austropuccinia psidii MF-1 TaxID=1389203 RepID=A0A9Q3ITS7_9BASI|nr:hypothetical protein [Austropuccinia psidii MF-1]
MAASRRPFKDSNHLAMQELGWYSHSGFFQGSFSEVFHHFNQLSRHQVFQYSLDNSIGSYRRQSINLYVLGPIGPIDIPLWELSRTVQISRWPDLYLPNSDNTAGDSRSRISLSTFHIYWPPFSTWGLVPQLINVLDLFLSLSSFTLLKLIPIILRNLDHHYFLSPLEHSNSPLKAQLDRGPIKEGAAPSRKKGRVQRRSNSFSGVEEENSVEEEESVGTEAAPAPVGGSEGTRGPTLAQSDQPVSCQTEPSLLAIMQQLTQIMANPQAAASSEVSRPPAFKTPSMKAQECFDGTQPFKVRSFIQSCQLIFHNETASFSQERKKVLYATSFLIGRAAKWIEPYLLYITNQDTSYLLNSWPLFE